jgi:hypothetical protein
VKKKIFIIAAIFLLTYICAGFACHRTADTYKPNHAELGEDWQQFRHDASQNVWVFPDNEPRPAEHRTPQGARVFWNGDVSSEELSLIDAGLTEMLAACRMDTNQWNPGNIWTKFRYFQNVSDYKVIFVESNYQLQEGETAGCAGMTTGAHGDCGAGPGTCTAAGTVGGLNDRVNGSTPGSKGGVYIIIPKQSPEQFARTECRQLMKNGVRNESEHVWMTNDPVLYFTYANDGLNGNHPYCLGMTGRTPPVSLFDITDEQIKEFQRAHSLAE